MNLVNRRRFLAAAGIGLGLTQPLPRWATAAAAIVQQAGQRPPPRPDGVAVINPRNRIRWG